MKKKRECNETLKLYVWKKVDQKKISDTLKCSIKIHECLLLHLSVENCFFLPETFLAKHS